MSANEFSSHQYCNLTLNSECTTDNWGYSCFPIKSFFSFLLCHKMEENIATVSDYMNYPLFDEEQK